MSKTGGARAGAGRKPGTLNQRTVELAAGLLGSGKAPLVYLLEVMMDDAADQKRRDWAAEKAAAYIHPRPAPVQREIHIDLPDTSTVEGIKAALSLITKAAASGQVSPAEAQSLSALVEAQRKAIETGELMERIERLEATQAQR